MDEVLQNWTLYAKLVEKDTQLYTVTFDAGGDVPAPAAQTICRANRLPNPRIPPRRNISLTAGTRRTGRPNGTSIRIPFPETSAIQGDKLIIMKPPAAFMAAGVGLMFLTKKLWILAFAPSLAWRQAFFMPKRRQTPLCLHC